VDGKKHGLMTEWYENGQKRTEGNTKDGKLHGLWTEWDEEGNVTEQAKFENGEKVE
jgi:antitoxin component YwqK of YwqJK toxin-antitoxin module